MRRANRRPPTVRARSRGTAVASASKRHRRLPWQCPLQEYLCAPLRDEHRALRSVPAGFRRGRVRRGVTRDRRRDPGMVMLKVAPMVPGTSRISPPCARTSSAAMARPRPVPPARVEPWNAWNRWARALLGHARPGVGNFDHRDAAFAPAGDADLVARRIARAARLQRLHRIAREIDENAEQLIVIGIDGQAALHRRRSSGSARRGRGRAPRAPPRSAARPRSSCGRAAAPARRHRTASIWQNAMARSSARISLGAKRCTFGSGKVRELIGETAAPRPAGCAGRD